MQVAPSSGQFATIQVAPSGGQIGGTNNWICFKGLIKLWRRPGNLHCFQYWTWSPDCITCIATSWIAILALSVGIELVSSSARVTSVKSQHVSELETTGPIDRTPGIPGYNKNWHYIWPCLWNRIMKRVSDPIVKQFDFLHKRVWREWLKLVSAINWAKMWVR